jgi:hypothetical protein
VRRDEVGVHVYWDGKEETAELELGRLADLLSDF